MAKVLSRALTLLLSENDSERAFSNWGKSCKTAPAVYVTARSVKEVQAICRDQVQFPSPVRASGAALSVTACHKNDKGTTIAMHELTAITGLYDMAGPRDENGEATRVRCVEVQAGVTLANLQRYLDQHNLEIPFCAEIGSATVGGVCLATTKDSSIGALCPSGSLGDFQSCLMSITLVDQNGQLQEHGLFNQDGSENADFQILLSSQGTRGIVVSMSIAVRPATPMVTTLHIRLNIRREGLPEWMSGLYKDARDNGGNIFAMVSLQRHFVLVESRRPAAPEEVKSTPISETLKAVFMKIKKHCFQHGVFSAGALLGLTSLRQASGSKLLSFSHPRRLSNFEYPADVPVTQNRLVFSYYSFDLEAFDDIVVDGLKFCEEWRGKTGFSPNGFAIYFVTASGKRTAGPYAGRGSHTSFSFDPIYSDPCDPQWIEFVHQFNGWAISKGGRPALNQTPEIERRPEWGALCVDGVPEPRFTSDWMKAFFDAKEKA